MIAAVVNERGERVEKALLAYLKVKLAWKWPSNTRAVRGDLLSDLTLTADSGELSAGTRLFNWKLAELKELQGLKNEAKAHFDRHTAPWVEDGFRLVPKVKVKSLDEKLTQFAAALRSAAREASYARDRIVKDAMTRRGRAFNAADYPTDLASLFGLEWHFDALTVPDSLRELSGSLAAAQEARQASRLVGAMQMAEQSILTRLRDLCSNLSDRLKPADSSEKVKFRDAALENVRDLVAEFSETILWGADDVADLMSECNGVIAGITAQDLRSNFDLKAEVRDGLNRIVRQVKTALLATDNA